MKTGQTGGMDFTEFISISF